eukprot:jgi/Astpho2/4995/Aster-06726
MSAASPEEPAAHQPLSQEQLSPSARRQADALMATSRPRGTHQERIEQADANWRQTLPHRQSQRLASAQRHDASREAAKQAVLASVQADIDSVVHTDACCHIRQHLSHEHEHQGRRLHQGGSREQLQQQQNSEGPASAAATAVRSQGKAVRYVGLAVTDGEVQLRSFSCACCDVWSVMPEAVACAPATPMQPQTIFADQLLWFFHHLTVGDSAVSATAFCAALSKMSDRPVDDRSFLPAYQRWRHVVRPLEDPDELAAHLQKIVAQPGDGEEAGPCAGPGCQQQRTAVLAYIQQAAIQRGTEYGPRGNADLLCRTGRGKLLKALGVAGSIADGSRHAAVGCQAELDLLAASDRRPSSSRVVKAFSRN